MELPKWLQKEVLEEQAFSNAAYQLPAAERHKKLAAYYRQKSKSSLKVASYAALLFLAPIAAIAYFYSIGLAGLIAAAAIAQNLHYNAYEMRIEYYKQLQQKAEENAAAAKHCESNNH